MRLPAIVLSLLLLAGLARAEDAPLSPVNPFESAATGDWFGMRFTMVKGETKKSLVQLLEVQSVEGDKVAVKDLVGGERKVFDRTKAPSIAEILFGPAGLTIADVKMKDEKRTFLGNEFDCKHATVKLGGGDPFEGSLWFAADAKVTGFLLLKAKGAAEKNKDMSIELEAVGFGTKEKTLWGLDRKEVEVLIKAEHGVADPSLAPFNPFEKAEVGDWLAFRTTVTEGDKKDSNVNILEVTRIEGDDVSVTSTRGGTAKMFSKARTPTLVALLGGPASWKLAEATLTDVKRTVSGREFDCKQVAFKIEGRKPTEGTFWFCADVKVTGFVAMEVVNGKADDAKKSRVELEVVGFGSKDKDLFGLSREDADKAVKGPEKKKARNKNPKLEETKVTCQLSNVDLKTALEMVISHGGSGVQVEFGEGVDPAHKVTIDVQDRTLADVFDIVVGGAGYSWEATGPDTILVKKAAK